MIITKLIEFKPQIHECFTWWSCLSLTVTNSLSEVLSVEWPPKINKNLSSFENLSDPLQDAGYYHCQLATHPPQLVWSRLELVRPVFKMSSSDLHYHRCVHCTVLYTLYTFTTTGALRSDSGVRQGCYWQHQTVITLGVGPSLLVKKPVLDVAEGVSPTSFTSEQTDKLQQQFWLKDNFATLILFDLAKFINKFANYCRGMFCNTRL